MSNKCYVIVIEAHGELFRVTDRSSFGSSNSIDFLYGDELVTGKGFHPRTAYFTIEEASSLKDKLEVSYKAALGKSMEGMYIEKVLVL